MKSVRSERRRITLPLVFFGAGILLASMFLVSEDLEGDGRVIFRVSLVALTLIFLAITLQIKRAAAKRRQLLAEQLAELLETESETRSSEHPTTS